MPFRKNPLVNNEIYHIINRGLSPIFNNKYDYENCIHRMYYYTNTQSIRYSFLKRFHYKIKAYPLQKQLVEILAFCLMPNHIHILLKQKTENGISIFMSNFQNSFVRYFNTKYKRIGPLFQGRFKAVLIENDNQLLHTSRYIHLNPYSSSYLKTIDETLTYPYSSINNYLNVSNQNYINTKVILSLFNKTNTYKKFLMDQADYQKTLDQIKHIVKE